MSAADSKTSASIGDRIAGILLDLMGNIPNSTEVEVSDPAVRARRIAHRAAQKAALASGGLALPPGALGWLTVLPELVTVWKLQSQMVADIAGIHGSASVLSREQMLYCLFRHTAAQAVRDLVVQMGERLLVQQVSVNVLQKVASRIGLRLTRHAIGKGIVRWMPVVGAIGVGAYAYYDTLQVAFTAIQLFQREQRMNAQKRKPQLLLPRPQRQEP